MDDVPVLVRSDDAARRVPVTVLTGFLGAGKSTLIAHLLRAPHGRRLAVVMNDVAPAGAPERAAAAAPGTPWVQLDGGCVCCSARTAAADALEAVLRDAPDVDAVLVEAAGDADPLAVVGGLWPDDALEGRFFLAGCVAVVDCEAVLLGVLDAASSVHEPAAAAQLAAADLVILNKADTVAGKAMALETAQTAVNAVNALAEVVIATRCAVDASLVLDMRAYSKSGVARMPLCSSFGPSSIRSVVFAPGRVSLSALETVLRDILWEGTHLQPGDTVLRAKGVFAASDGRAHALQAVRERYEMEELQVGALCGSSALVFVGRISALSEASLRAALQAVCV